MLTCARGATTELETLQEEHPEQVSFVALDLAEPPAAKALVDTAVERLGGIDVLVNNAAIGQDALLAHTPDEEAERIVALNLTATIRVTRLAVRRMLLDGGGVILNVSSICASRGYAGLTVYSATKGAIDAFTRSLARELGVAAIRVNAIAPGFFESEMSSVLATEQIDSIRRRTPTGRLSDPDDVVRAADVLIAPDANVTGQVLSVDGGASIA